MNVSQGQFSECLNTDNASLVSVTGGTHELKVTPQIYYTGKEMLTYSFWFKNLSNKPVRFRMNGFRTTGSTSNIAEFPIEPKVCGRAIFTGNFRDDYDWFQHQIWANHPDDDIRVLLYNAKLEKGTVATPYQQAPEDMMFPLTWGHIQE